MRFGTEFYKLSGSGNDFVFFEVGSGFSEPSLTPERIAEMCARGTGIGADGVVSFERQGGKRVRIRYWNSDGSRGALCGNATLCAAQAAVTLGAVTGTEFTLETDAGAVAARIDAGEVWIELPPVTRVDSQWLAGSGQAAVGEQIGFAVVGVPHLVVLCENLASIDVAGLGRPLRSHSSLRDGANVNFVARTSGEWAMRTYERGVEAETLACGTGAVATAILLAHWGLSGWSTRLVTKSGKRLAVELQRHGNRWLPRLSGEARFVFRGMLAEA
ncbi:MAG: diaminopimelate epimerase [Gemmatimonadaceae bacterium]